MIPICIYHGNCADGFGAAWAVWRALGDDVEFVPGFYGAEPPDVAERDVIIVDFSYKRPVLERMAETARSILILDHHKTAEADLAGLGVDLSTWAQPLGWQRHMEAVEIGQLQGASKAEIFVLFDMERSGAVQAWDFFHLWPVPTLLHYVQDRDLWRFELPRSRDVAAAVFSYPYDFIEWDGLAARMAKPETQVALMEEGAAIERKHHKDIAELVTAFRRLAMIAGHEVPVANLPYTMASDAGHLMAEGWPFAACYYDRSDGVRVFSLRSREGGVDVSEIAAQFGGGGHKHAAGFQGSPGDFGL